jgi:phage regulator Rha-like protein
VTDRNTNTSAIAEEHIEHCIAIVRGQRVMVDADLARCYGVTVKALNQAVKRNRAKFPPDFAFQLTPEEHAELHCLRSQFVTLKRGQHRKYLPWVFTEHGAIMVATVLNSARAVQMSVFVVRAFVRMRGLLSNTQELARKLAALEKELKGRLDVQEAAIVTILQRVMDLIDPPEQALPPPKQIGFVVRESPGYYRTRRIVRSV